MAYRLLSRGTDRVVGKNMRQHSDLSRIAKSSVKTMGNWGSASALESSPRLTHRTELHLARKVWHMGMGMVIVMIYLAGLPRYIGVALLGTVLAFSFTVEMIRLRNPRINDSVMKFWGPIMRSCETDRLSGVPFYIASCMIAVAIFPKEIAILSILYLAIGDPIASLMGISFGQNSWKLANGKSLVGTVSGMVACAIATLVFLNASNTPQQLILPMSVLGGFVGGAAELLPLEVDDNFSIPVVSGFVLWFSWILIGL